MASDFERALQDKQSPLAIDVSSDSEAMLIAFGGMRGALGMPPFEFFKVTNQVKCKKVFVRDLAQAYYQRGLAPIAKDIDGITQYLLALKEKQGVKQVVVVGNSMGGYAALLFGALLQAAVVHAFAPQTFIDYPNRLRYHEQRWWRQVLSAHFSLRARRSYFDLRKALQRAAPTGEFHIHFSQSDEMDRIYAEHMQSLPNVSLHPYDSGGHAVVKDLRDSGSLLKLLDEAFQVKS